jgi:ribosome-associated translation inhibitor RaiA
MTKIINSLFVIFTYLYNKKIMGKRLEIGEYDRAVILEMYKKFEKPLLYEQLDTTDNIKKFQDWMDTIGPWVKSDATGKYVRLNKGAGYGTAGTYTKAAWKTYGARYYKEVLGIDITPDDFNKISEEETETDVVTVGNVTTTTTKGCVNATVSGTFNVNVSTSSTNLTTFFNSVLQTIEKSEVLRKAKEKGTLTLDAITLIGGASNSYAGKTKPEMNNQRTFDSVDTSGTYSGKFTSNKNLAVKRATNLWTQIQAQLPSKFGISISPSISPKISGYNVDTGGKTDKYRDKAKYKNPGQFVMTTFGFCGVETSSTETPEIKTIEEFENCYQGIEIEVNFDKDVRNALKSKSGKFPDLKFHKCDAAVFEVFANGQQLFDTAGKNYADLNNYGTNNPENEPNIFNGIDKFAKFVLNSETNKDKIQQMWQDAQARKDYTGDINIVLRCGPADKIGQDPNSKMYGGNCHSGVGHVVVKNNGQVMANLIQGTPSALGSEVKMEPIQACKPTVKQK